MKAATLVPKKFRSVRDRSGAPHRRNKSSEGTGKVRPLTSDAWLSIFRPESAKKAEREKEEEEKEALKVTEISKRLAELKYHNVSDDYIRYALQSKFSAGDVEKAVDLLQLQQRAFSGIIQPYNPNVQMLGAINRNNVTCYLDALLFAMFAKLSAFECMLKNDNTNEAYRKLAALLRLWVNMLRSGKLIHTDLTQHIQESLAECGWSDAQETEQQDTSEAFAFITETLQLPLLALQVDLFHQGKGDKDDHKVVHERLLNLAVPPDPEGKGLKLEDCLEEYFNNKVDVLRDSWEEKKGGDKPTPDAQGSTHTIRLVAPEDDPDHPEHIPLQRRWTTQSHESSPSSSAEDAEVGASGKLKLRPSPRHRSTSIIQRIIVDNKGRPTESDTSSLCEVARRTGQTVVKAVTIPAWQFFRLIPWHAAANSEPKNNDEVVRHFNQRPVVGICLKRYGISKEGLPIRQNTLIDIPDSLRLPHFMMVDGDNANSEQDANGLTQEYKLVLQSIVCHRGDSVHSGHYISFARVAPKLLTDNRRHDHDPPPDYEEAQWAKFDDLAEVRVSYVDDIKQSLREEMPYLLFYQIVPMVDVAAASTDGSTTEPPAYDDSTISVTGATTPSMEPVPDQMSKSMSGYFDSMAAPTSTGPSIRFSSEMDRPPRLSLDDDPYSAFLKANSSRRASVALSESTAATPAITPSEAFPSPVPPVTPQEESTAARLSRAAARFTKSASAGTKSRPTSQNPEGRISMTMSRLGLVRPSKEQMRDENATAVNGGTPGITLTTSVTGDETSGDEQPVIVEEVEEEREDVATVKEKDHLLHLHRHHRKEKGKSAKVKEKEEKKEKGKGKDGKDVPDRECAVM